LRALTCLEIGPQCDRAFLAGLDNGEAQRCSRVPMPTFGSVHPVPMRMLAAREQKVDRGRGGPLSVHQLRVAEDLAEVAAFRVRLQFKQLDDFGRTQRAVS